MNKLFAAFLLIHLDLNINLGGCVLGLLPDFIGYILMVKGLEELSEESPRFKKLRPFAKGMALYTALLYAADLFGASVELGVISVLLGLASLAVSLYVSYTIIVAIEDIEARRHTDFLTERLKRAWLCMAVCAAISYALYVFSILGVIALLLGAVSAIAFLVFFYQTKERYYADSTML